MGNNTSSPLVSNEELSGGTGTAATDHQDNESESCWRFVVRKIYGVFGLDYQPLQDTPTSRKRRISEVESPSESEVEEDNGEDVERSRKTPRLSDIDSNSLLSRKDKDLEEQNVNVNIVTETMKHSVKAIAAEVGASDVLTASVVEEVETKDVVTRAPVEFMDFPFLIDEKAVEYFSRSWTILVIRGLAGSGKSTIVRQLESLYPGSVCCSADKFFLNPQTGEYQFDRSQLAEAHKWCQSKAEEACRQRVNIVIVDNTNVKKWEMVPYFKLADKYRYSVVVVEPRTPWRFNIDELARRNKHGVDRFILSKKVKDWESVRARYYGWFLSLPDSRLLVERAREVVEQCLSQVGGLAVAQYSRDNISSGEKCHCTAQFARKTEPVEPVETDRLGEVSRLLIAGFILTPRTLGARVILSQSQLELYKQNDLEPFSVASQHQKPQQARKSRSQEPPQSQSDCSPPGWDNTEDGGSLEEVELCSGLDLIGEVKGRRAHITLGCVGHVRPLQTGLDQLEVLRRLEDIEEPLTENIQAGTLLSLGQGCWLLTLTSPLSVSAVFTGSY